MQRISRFVEIGTLSRLLGGRARPIENPRCCEIVCGFLPANAAAVGKFAGSCPKWKSGIWFRECRAAQWEHAPRVAGSIGVHQPQRTVTVRPSCECNLPSNSNRSRNRNRNRNSNANNRGRADTESSSDKAPCTNMHGRTLDCASSPACDGGHACGCWRCNGQPVTWQPGRKRHSSSPAAEVVFCRRFCGRFGLDEAWQWISAGSGRDAPTSIWAAPGSWTSSWRGAGHGLS